MTKREEQARAKIAALRATGLEMGITVYWIPMSDDADTDLDVQIAGMCADCRCALEIAGDYDEADRGELTIEAQIGL